MFLRVHSGVSISFVGAILYIACSGVAHAGPVTFINDYQGFLQAAGNVQVIDFNTLPDGTPSHVGVELTPEFNYTDQGVTFSSATGNPFIAGNSVSGYSLAADGYYQQQRTWIIADFQPAASAVGVFFGGGMYLDAFNADGELIAATHFGDAGGIWFLGIVSDEPILRIKADKRDEVSFSARITDFAYSSVPEPGTLVLLMLGVIAAARWQTNP